MESVKYSGMDVHQASRILDIAVSLLPNLIVAGVVFGLFLIFASAAKSMVRRFVRRQQQHQTLGVLLGQLVHTTVVLFGFPIALSVIAPSFHAVDLIKMLGIGSVATGFAFHNIPQNFLAGILLLLHEPFRVGDQISVTGLEGRVDDIQTRATVISGPDGHRTVIPNAVLFNSQVTVSKPAPKTNQEPYPAKREPVHRETAI